MQINVSTRHGEISDATKEKIIHKVEKLQRFFDRLTAVDVVLDLKKADEPSIKVTVQSERRDDFVASYESNDMFGSIDQIVAKLEQQIKEHKEKVKDRSNKNPVAEEL
jgi:putative sigma-54 modulation protein